MYFDKVVLYLFFVVFLWVLITSIMSFIKVPSDMYTPYLYYTTMLFVFDLIITKQEDL